jgi:opacity protein-like surface antigen
MRRLVCASSCALLFMTIAAASGAQTTSAPDDANATKSTAGRPVYVHVNVGVQATSRDLVAPGAFELYEEAAVFETRGETGDGVLFDLGGNILVWRDLAAGDLYAGVSYSIVTGDTGGPLTGNVPDVLRTDAHRPISGLTSGLGHTEHAVHLQAIWRHPINNKIDVAVSAGPTIFSVSQELVSGFAVNDGAPPTVGALTLTDASATSVGFNVGVDASYRLTPRLFAGGFVRYAGGSVDLTTPGGNLGAPGAPEEFSLDVGGLQVGVGIRVRFSGLW